ncbi:glycosyltransferase [Paracoccaceae bacterium]|nr:glycosyltransferase [Paracoccaceae bacterium]
MNFKDKIKRFILKKAETLLFLTIARTPISISIFLSRLLRKILFREKIIEEKQFKNFQEYRDFIKVVVRNYSSSKSINSTKPRNKKPFAKIAGKKIFFICCDGNENKARKTPATFLDVWRDTAVEAGLVVKVSIANDFMYNVISNSGTKKIKYVKSVIHEINIFKADIVFLDINYFPSQFSLNLEDIDTIKAETKVPIYGFIGDCIDEKGVECAKVWLSSVDWVFHANIEMLDLKIDRFCYIPYTCPSTRYYPVSSKNVSIFFSGIGNISRLWYILLAKKFASSFLSNPQITFFRSSEKKEKVFMNQVEYDSMIRNSISVLDLTYRSRFVQNTSGRMFQAMASESTLIAEECNALNKLLKPFIEYLPFRNGVELKYALILLKEEPMLCKSIAVNGRLKFWKHHSPEKVWNKILQKAFLGDDS